MAATRTDLAGPVARYAGRLHDVIGYDHHVASPLGAWLLLALCGPASDGANRAALTEALGCDIDTAAGVAADLLAHPHPLVAAAAALWHAPGGAPAHWLAGLPAQVKRTPRIPDQPELDAWARRRTFGLIDKFPITVDPAVYLILANAVATKVSWDCPFDLAAGRELGQGNLWAQRLARVLRSPRQPGHAYAVVAVAVDEPGSLRGGPVKHGPEPGPWHGIPVFSAWVADPEEATGDEENAAGGRS